MEQQTPDSAGLPAPRPEFRQRVLRVLDANLNRCGEALRVVEDSARFVLTDAHLQTWCKELRHELFQTLRPVAGLVTSRDVAGDPGRHQDVADEYQRSDLDQVIRANLSRAGQSLRTLEEYGKLLDSEMAVMIENIRYSVYRLEKAILNTLNSRRRLEQVRLCALVEGGPDESRFGALIGELIAGGVDMIQLRDKQLDDRQLLARARQLTDLTRRIPVVAIVNDRVDLAVASGADGVHLGQEDLTVADVRKFAGPELLAGVSTHNLPQALQAVVDGASYIGVGPVFRSSTKAFVEFPGIEFVQQVASRISLPAFAIGGIDHDNLSEVIAAGLTRIAVSGALHGWSGGIREAAAELASQLNQTDMAPTSELKNA